MSTTIEVTVPDIGDFADIPVIEIMVKPGDVVQKDAPLVVLESDKATLDVPSPQSGIIKELKVAIGNRVSFGSTIVILDIDSSASVATPAPPPQATRPELAKATEAQERQPGVRPPRASPSVRRFGRELGVDLTVVTGTGPSGRILKADLQNHIKSAMTAPVLKSNVDGSMGLKVAPWPQIDFSKFGRTERAPLSKIRKLSGENLARNWVTIPHVTNFEEADITELDTFRQRLNKEDAGGKNKITMLAFLVKAAAAVLRQFPTFNSSLVGDELVLKQYFHVGFAADTPNGLVVPVIRDVDRKGISQIAVEAGVLASQARDGKLKLADMQGGCFTVSSLGGIGGTGFTPIINAPEVAILGVTRSQMRPAWTGTEFQPRLILPLALSWDHRVIDGAAAARFLATLASLLADFRRVSL
jgi:pyruvate dehydrogenase E2 component (dihydrolipoamide acetyltransferase)